MRQLSRGNYCAANAFMDSMGARRRARNLPAISLQWGPWADVGMAARAGTSEGPANNVCAFVVLVGGRRDRHCFSCSSFDCQSLLFVFLLFSAAGWLGSANETLNPGIRRQHRSPGSRTGPRSDVSGPRSGQPPQTRRRGLSWGGCQY